MKKRTLKLLSTAGLVIGTKYASTAQSFIDLDAVDNPLISLKEGNTSAPVMIDIDADGDLDLVTGQEDGSILTFTNDGGEFALATTNPFASLGPGYGYSTPAFIDIDADGDMDLVTGSFLGDIYLYENNAGVFTSAATNPFDAIAVGDYTAPTFVDIDADGDMDLVLGEYDGELFTYLNDGGVFTAAATNPFSAIDVGYRSSPSFVDIDADGDMDLVVGNKYGDVATYLNNAGVFTAASTNPFDGIDIGEYSAPSFADIDTDGDMDLILGSYYGDFFLFKNDTGAFSLPSESALVDILLLEGNTSPAFVDIDDDGDMDLVTGSSYGDLFTYINDGGEFTLAATNPLGLIFPGYFSAPTFVDIDGDGDMDVVTGQSYGLFYTYENNAGVFEVPTTDPLDGIDVGYLSTPAFVDIDGDGDMDLVSGNTDGYLHTYINTAGVFAPAATNPFSGLNFFSASAPAFGDIDDDGDVDMIVGNEDGEIATYINTAGTFAPPAINPFENIILKNDARPTFVDMDGDGDMDVVVGNIRGRFRVLISDAVVAVDLVSFVAEKNNSTVTLNWETANEVDSDYFDLERSKDGIEFSSIGTIDAKGNSNLTQAYSFVDVHPFENSYYRLKQVDTDGSIQYSDIQFVSFDQNVDIKVFPNPTTEYISIEGAANGNVTFYNSQGLMTKVSNIAVDGKVDVSEMNSGLYIIEIETIDKMKTRSLIVIK